MLLTIGVHGCVNILSSCECILRSKQQECEGGSIPLIHAILGRDTL